MGKFTFGQTGVSYECDKVDLKVNEGVPRCPRCTQTVYFNEEKKALGKSWHTRCFSCCDCKKTLSSMNYNQFAGEIMCVTCYKRHSTASLNATASQTTTTSAAAAEVDDENYDEAAAKTSPLNSLTAESSRTLPPKLQTVDKQDADCCPHCGRRVYFAEEILALRRKWHRLCFKCVSCKRTLEPGKCTEHEGQLFCYQCHHRHFGPHHLTSAAAAASVETRDDDGSVCVEATQPIRGSQEWTESFAYDQASSDYRRYRIQ